MDFIKSQRDWQQTLVYSHNDDTNSLRVEVVGGSDISSSVKEGLKEAFKDVKIEIPKAAEVTVIEVPKIVIETKIVEVPVIVKEIQIVEVQVPVIIKEVEIREIEKLITVQQVEFIEKPIIIEKIVEKDSNNKFLNKILIVQSIGLVLLSFLILFKK